MEDGKLRITIYELKNGQWSMINGQWSLEPEINGMSFSVLEF
jgi:hypothetical protein